MTDMNAFMAEINLHLMEEGVARFISTKDQTNSVYISRYKSYSISRFYKVELGLKSTSNMVGEFSLKKAIELDLKSTFNTSLL